MLPVTERDIQRWIYFNSRSSYGVLLTNYTPRKWFECDMFGVSRAGYFHEFEVKVSIRDFKADSKKISRGKYDWDEATATMNHTPGQTKHSLLSDRSVDGPALFWYVVPDEMLAVADVPAWAGLMYAKPRGGLYGRLDIVKPAPRLHKQRIDPVIVRDAMGVCYYRYWDERLAVDRLRCAERMVG